MTAPVTTTAPTTHPTPLQRPAVRATLCRDETRFAELEAEWNALHRRCATATPFQTHAWLYSWWRTYGTPGRLRLLLVRRGEQLIGAAPLMLTYRPLPVLVSLGGAVSDFCDVLIDDEDATAAVAAMGNGLRRAARHHVIDLREVRPHAAAQRLYEEWQGGRRRLAGSTCLELPALPMDGLVRRLATSRAQRVRAKLRKADAAGLEVHTVANPQDIPAAIDTLLRLHALQWQGRGITPEHLTERFAEHLARAVQGMVRIGDATVTTYRLDGETLAANLTLHSGTLSGGYLYGAHPELRRRKIDVAAMLLREDARHAAEAGRRVVSLLRGDEPYKHHWRPDRVVNQRLLLAPAGMSAVLALYGAPIDARRMAAHKARTLPPAVAQWRSRVHALRSRTGSRRAT